MFEDAVGRLGIYKWHLGPRNSSSDDYLCKYFTLIWIKHGSATTHRAHIFFVIAVKCLISWKGKDYIYWKVLGTRERLRYNAIR